MSRRCPSCGTSFPDAVFFCGNDGTITIQEQDPSDQDPRLGQQLGGYIVVARVADGAMGRVYEGRHPQTRARVAIKVLHADVARDHIAVERLKREYQTAAELAHPHVVKVIELGETPDRSWFMTMEFLEGEELSQAIRRAGTLSKERVIRILAQAAMALDHAHSFGVIHRDLKPDNVYVCRTPDGDDVRILDFGSVKLQMEMGPKLTAFGTTLGSPYYMSPEQAMGKQDVDQRTDIFAVAAILFEMVTGKIAFEGSTVAEILMKIVNESPPMASQIMPGVPAALDDVVDKGTRKDKTQRYPSCGELALAAARAYGLTGSLEELAHTPATALAVQLAAATPQAAPAWGTSAAAVSAPPIAPLGAPPSNAPHAWGGSSMAPRPPGVSPTALLIGVGAAVIGLAVIVGVVAALFLL